MMSIQPKLLIIISLKKFTPNKGWMFRKNYQQLSRKKQGLIYQTIHLRMSRHSVKVERKSLMLI